MRIPVATYRLQFTPDFGFSRAAEILDYLQDLGITDVYASPIFHARPGSTHGYDVVHPNEVNPELGSHDEFLALSDGVRGRDMGWLQDIVPNHMAFDGRNPYLVDVLENGPSSRYYHFFDILWDHFYDNLRNRVLAPFLGEFYGAALENGNLHLGYSQDGFAIHYYHLRFSLSIESYLRLLTPCLESLRKTLGEENPDYIQLLGVLYVLKTLRTDQGAPDRYNQIKFIKNTLWNLHRKSRDIRQAVDRTVLEYNGRQGDRESFIALDTLLAEQNFRLAFWKVAAEELNYRRFFSINDLISLQAEREEVFQDTHLMLLEMVSEGRFTGLRIDHIDGLCHPAQYLDRLREKVGDLFLVVEKITEPGETLPPWPVQGTTGYEFMNRVAGVFCRTGNRRAFDRIYTRFTGMEEEYQDLVYEKKKLIVERQMMGDINNLAHLLKNIASRHRYGSDITMYSLRRSLIEIMAAFPVYRSYFHPEGERPADRKYIRQAIQAAQARNPGLSNELVYLQKILLLEVEDFLPDEEKTLWLQFVMRFQQFTGPLMAKGFEDTLLYVYNRLLSLNDVGGAPDRFGFTRQEFHNYLSRRRKDWPLALSATATHDHKRGEDVRARLNVLSEIPQEWNRQIRSWNRLNRGHKGRVGRRKMPAANDEYFLYQTLLGTWPPGDFDREEYIGRIKDYVVKAVREAKVHTAWIKPDQDYEQTYLEFVDKILAPDSPFLKEFLPFQRRIARLGLVNSLSQTLIKVTAPGIPDFYQGTEFWDLSLVDPDNRRPVDYPQRRHALEEIRRRTAEDLPRLLRDLLDRPEDGRIKLFLIHRALSARGENSRLFEQGGYRPLEARGPRRGHLIAYARHLEGKWAITVAPRFPAALSSDEKWPLGPDVWQETMLLLPEGLSGPLRNAFTGRELVPGESVAAGEVFREFPAALLLGGD